MWQITKKNNSKAVKRTHPKTYFTSEKGSLRNERVARDCGFSRKNAVDVSLDDDGVPVLSIRNTKPEFARRPDRMWRRIVLKGGVRKAVAKAEVALADVQNPRIKKDAIAKVSALCQAAYRKNRGVDHSTLLISH